MHEWLRWLYELAEGDVEFTAIPPRGAPISIVTRDPQRVEAFARKHDQPGWGVYFGTVTKKPGTGDKRCAVPDGWQLTALWVDLDSLQDKASVVAILRGCFCPPSAIVDSGGGLHAYWKLIEPEDVSDATSNDHPLVGLLRGLRRVFAGDPAVCDLARIMRLPGTRNTKRGDAHEVRVVHRSDVVYSTDDLQDWLASQCELIGEPRNPWLAACEALGVKPALDVEQALATMAPGNVHERQLRVSASLLAAGKPEEEIVARLLEATRLAAGEAGRRWNWSKEEAGIREMIRGAGKKFQVVNLQQRRQERAVNGGDVAGPAEARGGKASRGSFTNAASIVMETWGRPIVIVDGEPWTYAGGIWEPLTGGLLALFESHIQEAGKLVGIFKRDQQNLIQRFILRDPKNFRSGVKWNAAPVVVAENGALDLETRVIRPHSPEHYATFKVACQLTEGATCPTWLAFLERALPVDTAACIATLQEWFGAMLVRSKARELNKGLMIYGPSYTGKTRISNIARALLGGEERCCSLEVRQLGESFGMQSMVGAAGWIADDAVGRGEVMDAERYKKVITGEPFEIARKNLPALRMGFDLPVLLTMNHFPKVHDNSDAVFNRSLALFMAIVIDKKQAFDVSAVVIRDELAGVLSWALAGWYRLRARGWFDPPEVMIASLQEFKSENNPFNEFAHLCVRANPDRMVLRSKFREAFNGWLMEEIQPRNPYSGKAIAEMIKHAMPAVTSGQDPQKRGRAWVGLELTEEAVQYLNGYDKPVTTLQEVNLPVPVSMRKPKATVF